MITHKDDIHNEVEGGDNGLLFVDKACSYKKKQ
jgi:hypothetical protein